MTERFTRRNLPHWDKPGAAYFVTTCLAGSIPALGLLDIEQERGRLERVERPTTVAPASWRAGQWKRVFARRERWLDLQPAVRYLERPELAAEVAAALNYFHGSRYDLIAWVVMPSHYHWVFRPCASWVDSLGPAADVRSPRQSIQHSVNSYSANRCNRILQQEGDFWQRESYDHWVRDDSEMERIIHYIHANPVVAGLVEQPEHYQFSSAYQPPVGLPACRNRNTKST